MEINNLILEAEEVLKDRFKKNYVLGPTHEELFTIAAKQMVRSYKDLPFNLITLLGSLTLFIVDLS